MDFWLSGYSPGLVKKGTYKLQTTAVVINQQSGL